MTATLCSEEMKLPAESSVNRVGVNFQMIVAPTDSLSVTSWESRDHIAKKLLPNS